MTPTALGHEALGDGAFVTDVLERGRMPGMDTCERLQRYMDQRIDPSPIDPPSPAASLRAAPNGRVLTFTLPEPFRLLNVAQRQHFHKRTRLARAMAWEIKVAIHGHQPAEPFRRAKVVIVRRSVGVPDKDGAYGGAKLLIDCLVAHSLKRHPHGLGIIVDDNPGAIDLEVLSERVPKRAQRGTTVTVTELLDPDNR